MGAGCHDVMWSNPLKGRSRYGAEAGSCGYEIYPRNAIYVLICGSPSVLGEGSRDTHGFFCIINQTIPTQIARPRGKTLPPKLAGRTYAPYTSIGSYIHKIIWFSPQNAQHKVAPKRTPQAWSVAPTTFRDNRQQWPDIAWVLWCA